MNLLSLIVVGTWGLIFLTYARNVHSQMTLEIAEGPGEFVMKDGAYELRVDNGETIKVACKVVGDDLLAVFWLAPGEKTPVLSFDDVVLVEKDTNKYSVEKTPTNNGANFIFGIYNLDLTDEKEYSCQHGENSVTMNLYVTTQPNITSITSLQTASIGEQVSIQCIAIGSPQPIIRWRHLRPTNQLPNGIEGSYKKGNNLEITSITVDDRGEYECIANNGVPSVDSSDASPRKTTYIRMHYAPTVEAILEGNPIMMVPEGHSTSLTCKSMSYPRSSSRDVVWFFETADVSDIGYIWDVVHELPSEKADPYEETTYSVLQVPEVNQNTTGQYKCRFRNDFGNDQAIIQLDIGEHKGGDTHEDKGGTASALSTPFVTIVTMLSAILWLVH